jgi:hypothetical protein
MRHWLKALLLACLLCAASLAQADRFAAADPPRFRVAQQGCLSLSEAVERVRRKYNGRIVSAETIMRGNREIHVIKVLTGDGKVKTEQIPGCTRGG